MPTPNAQRPLRSEGPNRYVLEDPLQHDDQTDDRKYSPHDAHANPLSLSALSIPAGGVCKLSAPQRMRRVMFEGGTTSAIGRLVET